MLLYLATAPLLPPCLKIAVNYKCSLNVSSDPEMQVRVRRRDWASPSLKGRRHYFFLSSSCFLQSFFSLLTPYHFFVFSIHLPFSISLVFLHIYFSSSFARSYSSVVFFSAQQEWAGLEDRGLRSFSPTHERAALRHRRPWLWNRFSLQNVRASRRVFVSLSQLPPLMQPQEWDVERKGMWRCAR